MGYCLRVQIGNATDGFTDYGPDPGNGDYTTEDAVTGFSIMPAGAGFRGKGSITMLKESASGFVIKSRSEVRIGVWNTTAHEWKRRLIGGFVTRRVTSTIKGAETLRTFQIEFNDYNILFDWLRFRANLGAMTEGGDYDFEDQVERICAIVTYNNAGTGETFEIDNALTGTLTTAATKVFAYKGKTLGDMLQDRFNAYRTDFPSVHPTAIFHPDDTAGASWGLPILDIYDDAAIAGATVTKAFDVDSSSGGVMAFSRTVDGADLQTSAQGWTHEATGDYYKTVNSSNASTYPNDYDQRPLGTAGAVLEVWEGPLMKFPDATPRAIVDAAVTKKVEQLENPKETVVIVTQDADGDGSGLPLFLRPGQVITVDADNESLVAQRYRVAQVTIDSVVRVSSAFGWWWQVSIQAGNKFVGLGESDEQGGAAVVEEDRIAPEPPTSPAVGYNLYAPRRFRAVVEATWTPSVSSDRAGYKVYWVCGDDRFEQKINDPDGASAVHELMPSHSASFFVVCYDGNDNESEPTSTVTFTTAGPPPQRDDKSVIVNATMEGVNVEDTTQPENWTKTVTGGATGALSTTQVARGDTSLALSVTTGALDAVYYTTDNYLEIGSTALGAFNKTYFTQLTYYPTVASGTAGTLLLYVLEYDKSGSLLTTGTAQSIALSSGAGAWTTGSAQYTISNASTTKVKLRVQLTRGGAANTVYVDGVRFESVTQTTQLAASAVTTDKLNLQTDTSGGSGTYIGFYDTSANLIAKAYADNTNHWMAIQGVLTGGQHNRVRLMSDDSTAILDVWDNSGTSTIRGDADLIRFQENTNSHYVEVSSTQVLSSGPFKTSAGVTLFDFSTSTNLTLTDAYHIVRVDASGGAKTITLPSAASHPGREYRIKKTDSSANAVTVQRAGSDTIEGATSVSLATQFKSLVITSDGGSIWYKWSNL